MKLMSQMKTRKEIEAELKIELEAIAACKRHIEHRLDRVEMEMRLHKWRLEEEAEGDREITKEEKRRHQVDGHMRNVWAHLIMSLDLRVEEAKDRAQSYIDKLKVNRSKARPNAHDKSPGIKDKSTVRKGSPKREGKRKRR